MTDNAPAYDWTAEDQADFDLGVNELFESLFNKIEKGSVTLSEAEPFFRIVANSSKDGCV